MIKGGKEGVRDGYLKVKKTPVDMGGGFLHGYDGSAAIGSEAFVRGIKKKVVPTLYKDTIAVFFEDAEEGLWSLIDPSKSKEELKLTYCASHIRDRALSEQADEIDVLRWMREYTEGLDLKEIFRKQVVDLYNNIDKIFQEDRELAADYLN